MQKLMCYCTDFALFYFEFEAISEYTPPGACIWRGDLSEGFLRYEFRGLIFGEPYTWRGIYMVVSAWPQMIIMLNLLQFKESKV